MMDPCKMQLLLTPQASKLHGFCTTREYTTPTSKKRIGNYFYYLNDCIGSGYSSQVFKGYKNDNKEVIFAIKVIRLSSMSKGNYQLLKNEIHILKQLNHPNIIKLHEVFYTENNCYIITDYCEGGTLQNHIESDSKLDWKEVFSQLMEGCLYLEQLLIIHRDIKPANIFKKANQWKIGDFGFARYVPYKTAQIKQMYMIGSPLYMPPQTLEKNIYSLKTDSFALGILFFHLVTKQFPWGGNNKKELIQNYASRKYPIEKLKNLPDYLQTFFKGLCQIEISRRFFISDFQQQKLLEQNFSLATQTTLNPCEDLIQELAHQVNLDVVERMKICKFIFYIDNNIQHFPQMCEISQNLRRLLKFFSMLFGWIENESYSGYLDEFLCRNYQQFSKTEQLANFNELLNISINNLEGSLIRRCQILRIKLIQLSSVVSSLMNREILNLKNLVSRLVLHSDFSKVLISPAQVKQIQNLRFNNI